MSSIPHERSIVQTIFQFGTAMLAVQSAVGQGCRPYGSMTGTALDTYGNCRPIKLSFYNAYVTPSGVLEIQDPFGTAQAYTMKQDALRQTWHRNSTGITNCYSVATGSPFYSTRANGDFGLSAQSVAGNCKILHQDLKTLHAAHAPDAHGTCQHGERLVYTYVESNPADPFADAHFVHVNRGHAWMAVGSIPPHHVDLAQNKRFNLWNLPIILGLVNWWGTTTLKGSMPKYTLCSPTCLTPGISADVLDDQCEKRGFLRAKARQKRNATVVSKHDSRRIRVVHQSNHDYRKKSHR